MKYIGKDGFGNELYLPEFYSISAAGKQTSGCRCGRENCDCGGWDKWLETRYLVKERGKTVGILIDFISGSVSARLQTEVKGEVARHVWVLDANMDDYWYPYQS